MGPSSSTDHSGSAALVSGGGSGLGAATGDALEAAGFATTRLDLRGGAGVVVGDVLVEDDVRRAVDEARAGGALRVAVACAGIAPVARVIGRDGVHDLELFRRTIDVNVTGTFNLLRLAAEAMQENEPDDEGQRGLIVVTASVAAFEGQIGQIAYAASKGAVAAMVLPAARDLARSGIRVVGLAPGTFDTPLLAGLPDAARASLAEQIPNPPRLGRPDEYARLVLAVLHNVMLNGTVIRLDGALRMGPR
jgi:NAD(P)-dependent dehydrogenase (short-subunit alcohol dehydrogenase family)